MLPVKQDKNRREKGPRLDAEPEMTKGAISMKQQVEPLQPIIDACKKGTPVGGVYLFCGEEAYLKRHYLSLLRKKLLGEPEGALFDWIRLSGDVPSDGRPLFEMLRDALDTPPLVCPGKLIEIQSPGLSSMTKEELEGWEQLLTAVPKGGSTAVVLLCGSEEFPMTYHWETTALAKKVSRFAQIVPFRYQTKAKLIGWVFRHLSSEGLAADRDTVSAFVEQCGSSMDVLSGEFNKLSHFLQSEGRNEVRKEDISEICCSAEEAEAFGISTAVIQRNIDRIFSEFELQKQQKAEPLSLFIQISSTLCDLARVKAAQASGLSGSDIAKILKLHPYKVKLLLEGAELYKTAEIKLLLGCCTETDLQLKQTSVSGYELVERLICRLAP